MPTSLKYKGCVDMKKIVIESLILSQKVAILENDKLVELFIDDNKEEKITSNIYRGIVKNIKPGMEAAFVDIGFEKLAYLKLPKEHNIKSGNEILVQINKEGIGTKGPKLNLEISISGRYLVYIPSNDRTTMSNKIKDEKERFRLKKLIKILNKDNQGLIVRTEAQGCSIDDLKKDLEELIKRYEIIQKEFKLGIGPKLLYKELDFASKYIKDNINESVEKIIINDKDKYEKLKSIIKDINKKYIEKIELLENENVFDLYKVQNQIEKSLNKKVWLKNGGYLIIEKTEALTVIDVNTGKFTGNIKLQDTVTKTNIEAAKEIANQLRVRDIGGMILIDFIDMAKIENKNQVIQTLESELKKDKRKCEVFGMTKLGLVEMTRRRERNSIDLYYVENCRECNENKYTKSIKYIIDDIEKEIIRIYKHTSYKNITILLNKNTYLEINEKFKDMIDNISKKYDIIIMLQKDKNIEKDKIKIIYNT